MKSTRSRSSFAYLALGLLLVPALAMAVVPNRPGVTRSEKVSRTQVTMTWKDKSSNERHFEIERRRPGGTHFRLRGETGRNVTEFLDTVLPGTVYLYRVRATNNDGSSRPSNTCFVNRTPPSKPIDVNAVLIGLTIARITWADRSATETGFTVERKDEGGRFKTIARLDRNQEEYTDSGLAGANTYTYRVRALGKPSKCIKHSKYSEQRLITTKGNVAILTVKLSGTGKGSVRSFPEGVNCAPRRNKCEVEFPIAEDVLLIPEPRSNSVFLKWKGQRACDGLNGACTLHMGRDREVTAVFKLLE